MKIIPIAVTPDNVVHGYSDDVVGQVMLAFPDREWMICTMDTPLQRPWNVNSIPFTIKDSVIVRCHLKVQDPNMVITHHTLAKDWAQSFFNRRTDNSVAFRGEFYLTSLSVSEVFSVWKMPALSNVTSREEKWRMIKDSATYMDVRVLLDDENAPAPAKRICDFVITVCDPRTATYQISLVEYKADTVPNLTENKFPDLNVGSAGDIFNFDHLQGRIEYEKI